MDEVSDLLRRVFQTEESQTLALSGTGSAGMEAGLSSLLEPGDTVIVCASGFFSDRMIDMAERLEANVVALRSEWGQPFPAEMLADELKNHPKVKLVTAVHAETSTGIRQPMDDLASLSKEHDALFMVDAVTSLGGNEVSFDRWEADYCYSATQKCLGCPPGLSPVALSPRAHEVVKSRTNKPSSWYLDLALIANYWGFDHVYHHTAPVSMILALREALRIVMEEGLEARFERHGRNASALRAGLEALGLELASPEGYRLDQITPFWVPEGMDEAELRRMLLREHGIEVGRGLGQFAGKVIRVGLMGESSKPEHVLALLSALERILPRLGYETGRGAGVGAASAVFAAESR
jgi:alanine-glyoxylate transaminase/serine-glyoxylate transaminase/serine-pyruvate transaminase